MAERSVVKSFELKKPISFGEGEEITKVDFYEPIGKDIRTMPAGATSLDDLMRLAVLISTIPSNGILDKFCKKDTQEVIKIALGFLGDGESEDET